MLRIVVLAVGLLIASRGACLSLSMNVVTNEEEKLVYLHMWGPIEAGDDDKFRSTVLPYLRRGYLLFEVGIFSVGGSVLTAMRIGDQIRTLQARTTGPNHFINEPGYAQCWFVSSASHGGIGYHPNTNYKRDLSTGAGSSWCDCASACFLIWASGVTREGNHIGIHRFRFDKSYFGSLSAMEARNAYARAEVEFRDYLTRLNVPSAVLDRLFATNYSSMYYLSRPELQLIQSTPYLEELVEAKCPPDKTRREYNPDGSWRSTTFDPVRIGCYRRILKELMRDGVKNYLASLGETAPPEGTGGPFVPIPVQPVTTDTKTSAPASGDEKHWLHNGSRMQLHASGNARKFVYEIPRDGLRDVGVKSGTILFNGRRDKNRYVGKAYLFSKRCGAVAFDVTGDVSADHREVTVSGKKPRLNSRCRADSYEDDTLVFTYRGP